MVPKPKRRVLHLKETFAIDRIISMNLMPRNMSPSMSKGFLPRLHRPGVIFKPVNLFALIGHRGSRLAIESFLLLAIIDNIMFSVTILIRASDMPDLEGGCFLVERVFLDVAGFPSVLRSDRGKEFVNHVGDALGSTGSCPLSSG